MRPHPSLVAFTVLAGAGQGLFVTLVALEAGTPGPGLARGTAFAMSVAALALLGAGLVASFFHLGRPSRAWRAASAWRSSWLSREVIVLPLLAAAMAGHAGLLAAGAPTSSPAVVASGAMAALLCALLWACTAMIYAGLRMVPAWATPLTPLGFLLVGMASGAWLGAAGLALARAPASTRDAVLVAAGVLTVVAGLARIAWFLRARHLRLPSTVQSALGLKRGDARQVAMGFTGTAFATREFFHGRSPTTLRMIAAVTVAFGGLLPLALGAWSQAQAAGWTATPLLLALAAGASLVGALADRWLFFAQAWHPQNLYHQRAS